MFLMSETGANGCGPLVRANVVESWMIWEACCCEATSETLQTSSFRRDTSELMKLAIDEVLMG